VLSKVANLTTKLNLFRTPLDYELRKKFIEKNVSRFQKCQIDYIDFDVIYMTIDLKFLKL